MALHLEHLRVDHQTTPVALAGASPRFAWWIRSDDPDEEAGVAQAGYRIVVSERTPGSGTSRVADTGRVDSGDQIAVEVPGFTGRPGADYGWVLQVWLVGRAEPLLAESTFGVARRGWDAPWIEPEQTPVVLDGPVNAGLEALARAAEVARPHAERLHPPLLVRQRVRLGAAPTRARLRLAAQGVVHVTINGVPVSDDLLEPGYDAYDLVTPVATHDVTALLHAGENVVGIVLGDGWYAGRISFLGRSAQYGDVLRTSWELEVHDEAENRSYLLADDSARSSRGPIDWSDLFIGERHDARLEVPGWDRPGFEDTGWTPCRAVLFDGPAVRPFAGQPVRRTEERRVERVWRSADGAWILDVGQVIAGRMRMRVQGPAGTTVRLEHSEVVSPDGEFVQNILGVNKDQTDEYVLRGSGVEEWEPLLTFHGFRYVRVSGYPGEVRPEQFTAVVLGDALDVTAGFASSDARLDRLFANALWSQRANFLAVPTDCPQRERAGYTGDLQVFAPTAATLMDVAAVLARWLGTVRAEQTRRGGAVPVISPEPPAMPMGASDGGPFSHIGACAGWGDAITIVPWALWRHFGDVRFLADNVDAMRDWVDLQARQAAEALPARLRDVALTAERRRNHDVLWNGQAHFGDWVTPSTLEGPDLLEALLVAPRLTAELVAPMFQVRSLDILARTLEVLGEQAESERVGARAQVVRDAWVAEYLTCEGRLEPDLQGMYVLALAFGMVPEALRRSVTDRLVTLVRTADDHLDTGFLSTPHLLDVLWESGHREVARAVLWQDTCPSWLYEVAMGATTIWESWNAVRPDGTAELTSMNHYANGCVADWMVRRLVGLVAVEPAYGRATLSPDLDGPLDHVRAHLVTPYGRVGVAWVREGAGASIDVEVPVGLVLDVVPGAGWRQVGGAPTLVAGRHRIELRTS